MSGDDHRLREDVRAVADWLEADVEPEGRVAARLEARMRRRQAASLAVLVAAAVVLVAVAVGLRAVLPGPGPGRSTMPQLVGVFRSQTPDDAGRCVAVRLYDTTPVDLRVAVWSWTGSDGCSARSSNLAAGQAIAEAIALPAMDGLPQRTGIHVEGHGIDLVLDPPASQASPDGVAGYWSPGEVEGPHTLDLTRVDELRIPYRPE